MQWLSCSSAGWDYGGLGEGDWYRLGHGWEGLWCCLDLFLPLEGEHHFLKANHLADVSFISHLANSAPWGLAEGDWVHEVEWPWEHIPLLKEGLADLFSLCRPDLAMHLVSYWCSSFRHSSCCLWGSMLGATPCSPCRLVLQPSGSLKQGALTGPAWRGVQGPTQLSFNCDPWEYLQCSFSPHGSHIVEHVLQKEHAPFVFLSGTPAQIFAS